MKQCKEDKHKARGGKYCIGTGEGGIKMTNRMGTGIAQSLRTGRSGDRIPVGGELFRTRPHRPWGPPSLLYNGQQLSFPEVKRTLRDVDHPPPSSAAVKERVELYLYSPSGLSWPVTG